MSTDIDSGLIPYMIQRAENGCIKSARELIKIAAQNLRSGNGIHEKLAPYLAAAFEAIGNNGESADKALKLAGKQGTGKDSLQTYDYKRIIFARVEMLQNSGKAKNVNDALEITCKILTKNGIYLDISTIKKYYYAYKKATSIK